VVSDSIVQEKIIPDVIGAKLTTCHHWSPPLLAAIMMPHAMHAVALQI